MNILPGIITAGIEASIHQALKLDPHARQQLAELNDEVIAIHWTDCHIQLFFLPTKDKLLVLNHYDGQPSTQLTGHFNAFVRRQFSKNKTQALFQGEIEIVGNTQVGEKFNQILNQFDIDWEERLAHVIGDVAAHQVGRLADKGLHWLTQFGQKITANTQEYLQEEKHLVPTQYEVDAYHQAVDQLRSDVDRLAARLQRLL